MSTRNPMPFVRRFFLDLRSGFPVIAANYRLHTYLVGTSTDTETWQNDGTLNANPIVLDSEGSAEINLDPAVTYKFELRVPADTTVVWDADNIPGSIPANAPWTLELDGIGVTPTDALIIKNDTVSANGAQQMSPRIRLTGAGWNATSSASRVVDGSIDILPIQQASGDPIVALNFSTQVNAGGYTPRMAVRSDGAAVLGSAGKLAWSSSGLTSIDTGLTRTAARKLALDDGAGGASTGVVLDFSTADTLKVRNRADGDYANTWVRTLLAQSAGDAPVICSNPALADNTLGGGLFFGRQQATDEGAVWFFRPQAVDANSTVELVWYGSGVLAATFDKGGTLALQGALQFNDTSESIVWSTQSKITGVGDGILNLTKNAGTIGIGLRFTTDGLLEVRNRANSQFADIKGLNITGTGNVESTAGFIFNGISGLATFGPAAPASITVKGGLITAAT